MFGLCMYTTGKIRKHAEAIGIIHDNDPLAV